MSETTPEVVFVQRAYDLIDSVVAVQREVAGTYARLSRWDLVSRWWLKYQMHLLHSKQQEILDRISDVLMHRTDAYGYMRLDDLLRRLNDDE